jgi:hypothetical protein
LQHFSEPDLYIFDHFPFSEVRPFAVEIFCVTCLHLKVCHLPSLEG